jgi:ATP-binding cassette, subfamily B, bacterial MsbA
VLLSIFLLFITSWRLSLVMLAVVPVLVGVTRVYGLFIRRFSKMYQDALAGASEVAQETLSNVRTVHSFAADQVGGVERSRVEWSR